MSDGSTLLTEAAQPEAAPIPAPAGNPAEAQEQPTGQDPHVTAPAAPEWRLNLPEDLRNNPSLSKFETVEGMAKSYANLERMLGGDKVPVPKDWDDEGQRQMLIEAVRPAEPAAYNLPLPENLDDELVKSYSKDEESYWRQTFHEAGLSEWQAKKLFEAGVKPRIETWQQSRTDQDNQRQEAVRALQREWGGAYDANVNAAKVALNEYADEDFRGYLDQTGLGNHPKMLRAFAKIGQQMMGDRRLQGGDGGPATPADLDAAITEFRSKHSAALLDKDHIEHDLRVRELQTLFNKRYGA